MLKTSAMLQRDPVWNYFGVTTKWHAAETHKGN
jgi:hypothetical protein